MNQPILRLVKQFPFKKMFLTFANITEEAKDLVKKIGVGLQDLTK